jgi:twitching motility protein PilT
VFPAGDKDMVRAMIGGSLQAVISQALLKKVGGGRVAAHDLLVGTPAVRNLIRENKIPQIGSMMQMGQRYGMQTMEDAIRDLVAKGVVGEQELERFATPGDQRNAAQAGNAAAAPSHAAPAAHAPEPRHAPAPAPAPVAAPPPPPQKKGVSSLFR